MTLLGYPSWTLRLVLLMTLKGCVTTTPPAHYEDQATSAQVPAPSLVPSESPVQPPMARVRPAPPVEPGPGAGGATGATARLLKVPAAILAMLLWPSELEGERLSLD